MKINMKNMVNVEDVFGVGAVPTRFPFSNEAVMTVHLWMYNTWKFVWQQVSDVAQGCAVVGHFDTAQEVVFSRTKLENGSFMEDTADWTSADAFSRCAANTLLITNILEKSRVSDVRSFAMDMNRIAKFVLKSAHELKYLSEATRSPDFISNLKNAASRYVEIHGQCHWHVSVNAFKPFLEKFHSWKNNVRNVSAYDHWPIMQKHRRHIHIWFTPYGVVRVNRTNAGQESTTSYENFINQTETQKQKRT